MFFSPNKVLGTETKPYAEGNNGNPQRGHDRELVPVENIHSGDKCTLGLVTLPTEVDRFTDSYQMINHIINNVEVSVCRQFSYSLN